MLPTKKSPRSCAEIFCFLLDAGHVEDIEGGQLGFEVGGLLIGLVERRQRLVFDVLRDAQFLRRDEDEPVPSNWLSAGVRPLWGGASR